MGVSNDVQWAVQPREREAPNHDHIYWTLHILVRWRNQFTNSSILYPIPRTPLWSRCCPESRHSLDSRQEEWWPHKHIKTAMPRGTLLWEVPPEKRENQGCRAPALDGLALASGVLSWPVSLSQVVNIAFDYFTSALSLCNLISGLGVLGHKPVWTSFHLNHQEVGSIV